MHPQMSEARKGWSSGLVDFSWKSFNGYVFVFVELDQTALYHLIFHTGKIADALSINSSNSSDWVPLIVLN